MCLKDIYKLKMTKFYYIIKHIGKTFNINRDYNEVCQGSISFLITIPDF